jgi:hypothetical protein
MTCIQPESQTQVRSNEKESCKNNKEEKKEKKKEQRKRVQSSPSYPNNLRHIHHRRLLTHSSIHAHAFAKTQPMSQ